MEPLEFFNTIKRLGIKSGDLVELQLDHDRIEIWKFCGAEGNDTSWVAFIEPDKECGNNGIYGFHIGHIMPNGIRLLPKK